MPRSATFQDYRRLLDRAKSKDKLDAVIIATPDHHHAQAAILALQAGLDVYLEKPLTVTIREGRLLADAVKRTGRVLQVGSQQRTMEVNRFACEFIRNGGLGRITKVELPNYPGPLPMPPLDQEPAFGGVDFDLFCGPAPLRPHHRHLWMKEDFKVGDLLWRGWDLFRDYSGHLMTNWEHTRSTWCNSPSVATTPGRLKCVQSIRHPSLNCGRIGNQKRRRPSLVAELVRVPI